MFARLERRIVAFGIRLRQRFVRWIQPSADAFEAWVERTVEPFTPAPEQQLSADAIIFETLAIEPRAAGDALPRRLFAARILAQLDFLAERAAYANGAAAAPDVARAYERAQGPILAALGLGLPFVREDVVAQLAQCPRAQVLAAWHASLRRPLVLTFVDAIADLDRRATTAVLDALAEYRVDVARETGGAEPRATTGVALSGGGIRSASFALGVLQELAKRRLLYGVDYLSAVSGGGYAASWLTTWAYRHGRGIRGVEDDLDPRTAAPPPLRWVRRYGVYLAPHFGVFAPDLWSLGVTYVRNTLPILCITVPLLAAIVALPHVALGFAPAPTDPGAAGGAEGLVGTIVLCALPYYVAVQLLRRYTLFTVGADTRTLAGQTPTLMAAFAVGGGLATAFGLARLAAGWGDAIRPWMFVAGAVAMQTVAAAMAPDQARRDRSATARPLPRGSLLRLASATLAAGALAGVGFYAAWRALAGLAAPELVAFGPLAFLLALGLGETAFATVMTPVSDDVDRAWWSRAATFALLPAVVWTLVCAISFAPAHDWRVAVDPKALWERYGWWLGSAGAALVGAVATLLASARVRALIAKWTPRVVLVVVALLLLAAIAWGTNAAIRALPVAWEAAGFAPRGPATLALLAGAAFFALAALASIAVNLNRSSLHGLYRDGLIRTFLGASRRSADNCNLVPPAAPLGVGAAEQRQWQERAAERFTDIDDDDNPGLAWLRPRAGRRFPLLLVNASLNGLVPGKRRGREARQYPFTFGPIHCGSPVPGVGYGWTSRFFRASKMDKKLTLGTAMAVSGAAVSPNPGRTGSSLLSFLLTMANARIGLWIGNPRYRDTPGQPSPGFGLPYLAHELFGLRGPFGRWIQVSDGGHFENIGLHELIRRRCGRIVVVDASCDPARAFADIGDAIRRARIDLNVDILATGAWRIGDPELGAQGREWATFDIAYPGGGHGRMLYIKPSLYDDSASALPMDVLDYWSRHAEFPHESTANQFFSEAQLEAYRSLGRFCAERALDAVLKDPNEATWAHWLSATRVERTIDPSP